MKKSLFHIGAVAFAAAVLLAAGSGCRSDEEYRAEAIERARKYLLERSPELTPEQIFFVRYNEPVLMTADVLGNEKRPVDEAITSRQRQLYVSWEIPGTYYHYMVWGVTSRRMDYYYPNRLIRKTFLRTGSLLDPAIALARRYAVNYLQDHLAISEFNEIRYGFPWVIQTNFELESSGSAVNEVSKFPLVQVALAWPMAEESGEAMLFCGTSRTDLTEWKINFAGRVPLKEIEERTVRVLRNPTKGHYTLDMDVIAALDLTGIDQAEPVKPEEPPVDPEAAKITEAVKAVEAEKTPEEAPKAEPFAPEVKIEPAVPEVKIESAEPVEKPAVPEVKIESAEPVEKPAVIPAVPEPVVPEPVIPVTGGAAE